MKLVLGLDYAVAQWVSFNIPHSNGFGPCTAIGIMDANEELAGGVVFNNYQPEYGGIEISFVARSPKCLTKNIICGIFAYPFDQLRVKRVTAVTPRKAASARRFLEKFGFKREGVLRRGFGNDDAIIYGLLEKEWRRSRFTRDAVDDRKEHATPTRAGRSRQNSGGSNGFQYRNGAASAEAQCRQ